MDALQKLQEFAAAINALTTSEADSIQKLVAVIEGLKGQLVNAVTPEQVDAILAAPLAGMKAVADTLAVTAAGNSPDNVPPPTPEQPPL